jgi:hypothetical protein
MKSYETQRRKKTGNQPGNFNGDSLRKFSELAVRRSGMITEEQLTAEIEGVSSHKGLTVEIAMLRYVMHRLMQLFIIGGNPDELLRCARGLGFVGDHLAQMLLVEKKLDLGQNEMHMALFQAIDEVLEETEEKRKAMLNAPKKGTL